MTKWRPIETAPQDEFIHTVLIARNTGNRAVLPAYFDGSAWKCVGIAGPMEFVNPTHWMPLPEPPQ